MFQIGDLVKVDLQHAAIPSLVIGEVTEKVEGKKSQLRLTFTQPVVFLSFKKAAMTADHILLDGKEDYATLATTKEQRLFMTYGSYCMAYGSGGTGGLSGL